MELFIQILLLVISYLIGSIPFGLIIGKVFKNVDIREHGSKSIGSTNAIRVLGKPLGFTVFALDVFKGAFIIIIIRLFGLVEKGYAFDFLLFYGIAAILGHGFSIYLKFKGGKIVATSLGVVLALTPIPAILCLIVLGITIKLTGYSALGSTFAAFTVVISTFIMNWQNDKLLCILYALMGCLILIKHRKNYVRLLNGTENCFKKKKQINTEEKKAE